MKLEQKLRADFHNKIRSTFVKDECEYCGCNEKLELHHAEEHFATQVIEVLEVLRLEYHDDITMYSDIELRTIRELMLGKAVRNNYLTLCEKCHLEEHKIVGKDRRRMSELRIKRNRDKRAKELPIIKENVKSVIIKYMDRELFTEDRIEMLETLRAVDMNKLYLNDYRSKSLGSKSILTLCKLVGLEVIVTYNQIKKGINRGRRALLITYF